MTTEIPKFTPNELVWYEEGGEIHSAGYKVESLFKSLGIAPMTTLNKPVMDGGCGSCGGDAESFSDLFRFMGVPAGLSTVIGRDVSTIRGDMAGGGGDNEVRRVEGGLVSASLYDKLVQLAGPGEEDTKPRKKQTRKRSAGKVKEASKSGKKRTTRKHRR